MRSKSSPLRLIFRATQKSGKPFRGTRRPAGSLLRRTVRWPSRAGRVRGTLDPAASLQSRWQPPRAGATPLGSRGLFALRFPQGAQRLRPSPNPGDAQGISAGSTHPPDAPAPECMLLRSAGFPARRSFETRFLELMAKSREAFLAGEADRADRQSEFRSNLCIGPRRRLEEQRSDQLLALRAERGDAFAQDLLLLSLLHE